jgi:Family of unknown function (DUF6508)
MMRQAIRADGAYWRWRQDAVVATVGTVTTGDPGDADLVAAMESHPAELWERLFVAADALEAGSRHASWRQPAASENSSATFPYPVYSDTVEEIQSLLHDLDVIVSFDWPAWDGAAHYPRGEGLASAPVAEAARVATVVVRGERFCDGTIAQAISDGTLNAVLGRLRRWFEAEYHPRHP